MVFIIIFAITLVIVLSGIRVIHDYQKAVAFRFGRFEALRDPGIYWLIPFVDRHFKIDTRIQTFDLKQQEAITKDRISIKINALLGLKITNPMDAITKVADYRKAVQQFSVIGLRNVVIQHTLDEVLGAREQINTTLRKIVDAATEPWGIKIEMIEIKDVEIPVEIKRSMSLEAEALGEKRARIVKADAEIETAIRLTQAAKEMENNPIALELRKIQMILEMKAETQTTNIVNLSTDSTDSIKSQTDVSLKKGKKT